MRNAVTKEGSNSPYSQVPSTDKASRRGLPVGEEEARPQEEGLCVTNIRKSIHNRWVVNRLSLRIRPGELVGMLGPNGAGKSTCFEILAGFLPCDCGSIRLNGNELSHLPADRRARQGLAFLPQETSIFRRMSVADNLRAMLELRGLTPAEVEYRLHALLKQFQLVPLAAQMGTALSGGERRRTELARALAGDPDCLLLDEPFAGLDPISIHAIRKILRSLSAQGMGILINDHNAREILELCDRTYVIERGNLLAQGDTSALLANPAVHESYLGEGFRA